MNEIKRMDLKRFRVLYIPVGVEHPHFPAVKHEKPIVEFYDREHMHTPDGQFTGGRYYIETLLEDSERLRKHGLCLHGGVPEWVVSTTEMEEVLNWMKNIEKESE